jgi:CubicO group peptidase (beta-lactamase class C family)
LSSEDVIEKVETLIDKLMQGSKTPGLSLSIIKDNKPFFSKGYGARDIGKNLPATENTLFGIGSLGKSFTCLAIMQLAEKGLLSIEDPASKYIPLKIGIKDNPIKIRDLMSHTSGLPDLGMANVMISRKSAPERETYVPMSDFNDFMRFVNQAQDEILDVPGKRFHYFNAGYSLLGLIIKKVSGLTYEEYIEQNILKPLEMNRSTYIKEKFDADQDRMTAYFIEKEKFSERIHPFDKFINPAGGIVASVKEMENYMLMHLNEGAFKKTKIVSKESIKELFAPRIKTSFQLFGGMHYCFGWGFRPDFFGEEAIVHTGSTGFSSAAIVLIPKKKMGCIVAGNIGAAPCSMLCDFILSVLLGKNPMVEHPTLSLDSKLGQLVGQYSSYKGLNKIEVLKKGGLLYLKSIGTGNETETPLLPVTTKADDFNFIIPQGYFEMPCEFIINKEKNRIDLVIERAVYHKIGPLKIK